MTPEQPQQARRGSWGADRGVDWREDLQASVQARRDLGPGYEAELVDSFLDRVDRDLDARIDARLARDRDSGGGSTATDRARDGSGGGGRDDSRGYVFVLGLVSLGTGIPLTAIAGGQGGLTGVVVSWLGIVGVNAAHAFAQRGRRR